MSEPNERIEFILDGCDISFVASAPADITLRQLLAHLLREFSKDKANRGVSAFVDINGYE